MTKKYHNKLKFIYKFKNNSCSNYSNLLRNKFDKLKSKGKFLVGVHIRRGDYKTWNNGKYYFDDSTYNKVILNLRDILLKQNKEPLFIIVSNEIIPEIISCDYKINGSWIDDQIALQSCNLIVGPPSTFTLWASYISRIPIVNIECNGRVFFKNKFICDG